MNDTDFIKKQLNNLISELKANGCIIDDRFNEAVLMEIDWANIELNEVYNVWDEHIKKKIKQFETLENLINKL